MEPQTSAIFSAAPTDCDDVVRLFIIAEDAFAMQTGRASTIECALGAAYAAGD